MAEDVRALSPEQLAERLEEMQQQLETFQSVTENATDGIALIDFDGDVTYGNHAWYELFAYDYDGKEMEGLSLGMLWDEADMGKLQEEAMPQAVEGGWRGEARLQRKDGSSFVGATTLYPLEDKEGEITGLAQIVRDVTEERETQETIRRQNEAIMEMSTPVVQMWDGIILLPLIGSMDTVRSQQMTQTMLESIAEREVKVVILDVTGLPSIDTSVARHVLQAVDAARILGAEVVVTGFSPESAQTLSQLGVDFAALRTRGSLRAGTVEAFALLGFQITRA